MKRSNLSVTLDELAIRTSRAYRQSGDYWMVAAAGLVEARDLVPHGAWGAHLAKTGVPERTAQRMMRISRAGVKCATVALLGVARVDEILGWYADTKEIPGVPDDLFALEDFDWDYAVMVTHCRLEPAWELRKMASDMYYDAGDFETAEIINELRPTTGPIIDAYMRWAAAYPLPDDEGNRDPDEVQAWHDLRPWLPGNVFEPEPDPEPVAA